MTYTISDPGSRPLRNPHPFTGSETLEPTPLPDRIPTDHSPESAPIIHPPTASTSLFGWPGDRPGRLAKLPARAPFDRLKFWRVQHELTHRLKPYQATDVSLMFRQASWGTILYWSQLLDTVEVPRESLVDV